MRSLTHTIRGRPRLYLVRRFGMERGVLYKRLDALKAEGRYRVFAELERRVGEFPRALEHRLGSDVTVWRSNVISAWGSIQLY